jgi:L-lysine exporter family protein LysE/ArgO
MITSTNTYSALWFKLFMPLQKYEVPSIMIQFSLTTFIQGFGLGAGLIVAIGAQNAFVLRQGLKRQYVFITASICTLCDAILIALGVGGLGTIIASTPLLTAIATWGGAAFLLFYGFRSFRSALSAGKLEASPEHVTTLRNTILAVMAFSLLNPHVYLDTVVLVGSIGAHYPANERIAFALGAMSASLTWFFGLAYGAAWLAPLFRHPLTWKILDCLIGCIMWTIAISLIRSAL